MRLLAVVLLGGALAAPRPAHAQADTLAEARRLRDARELAAAVGLLGAFVADHPGRADAARLLAETLYWLRRDTEADAAYAAALERHADDPTLRLEYGRFLAETGRARRARTVLAPLLGRADMLGRAEAQLGALAYWEGDLVSARRLLEQALAADPAQPDARRQLDEIRAGAAPWLRTGAELRHDDQPLDRLSFDAAAGWFPTPLLAATARAGVTRLDADDDLARTGGSAPTLWQGEAELSHYAPRLRLETAAAAGAVQRSAPGASDWTGRVKAGVRLPAGVVLRARAARAPYLHTVASLRTPVMTTTVGGELAWQGWRGWLGEAAVQRERYPDRNAVTTAYAWLLAPVVQAERAALQLGYGVSAQDARESRFVLADSAQPFPPGHPRFSVDGRYAPYWTPSELRAHALLASLTLRPRAALALHAGASVGVRAHELAPSFAVAASAPPGAPVAELHFARRDFRPRELRATVDAALTPAVRLALHGEHRRTAFYAATTVGMAFTWRLGGGMPSRAAGSP